MPTHGRFFSLKHSIAQIEFNKTIAGCYRDGNAEYDSVGVLLLTWREDDLNCKEKEVNSLEQVFKEKFNFNTEQYEIPPIESKESLFNRLQAFIRCYDSPSKLGIIYYGGHAEKKEHEDSIDLELFARRSAHGVPNVGISRTNTSLSNISIPESPIETKGWVDPATLLGPRPEQPHISFKDICEEIRRAETDMLLIVDSCFAASAFTDQPFGGRKCELLCSIAEKDLARAPGLLGSFTKILTTTLRDMIGEKPEGFSTSDLYRRVYQQQQQNLKPLHFTQSRFDFGRIWLRPYKPKDDNKEPLIESKYTVDVRFHLLKSLDMMELNKVVKALQWIPYVQMVKMRSMHSPSDDLIEFTKTVHQANRLRPLLARIREKLEMKRVEQLSRTDSSPPSPVATVINKPFYIDLLPRDVGLFDWSTVEAVTPEQKRWTAAEYWNLGWNNSSGATSADDGAPTETQGQQRTAVADATREVPTQEIPVDALSKESKQDEKIDESKKLPASLLQQITGLRLSQRTLDGMLFFAMGVLAPTVLDWAMHGSASLLP